MIFKVTTSSIYKCTLERAFKTPMLCDVSKVHTGKGIMPRVTHCTEDENWGQIGSIKKVHVAKSLTQKGGFASTDKVLERVENDYWVIEVTDFQSWMLGFWKFNGRWETNQLSENKIKITYSYDLHAKQILLYPLQWMFVRFFWKGYMRQVLNNIKTMAEGDEPYLFE